MNHYIVSARKYRPSTFRSVVGQRLLTITLKNAIQNSKLAHAYLFCGPRGVGKTTCARILAKTINCMCLTKASEACDKCESCSSFNENRSYNIYELDAASNNSVEAIRSIIEQVRIPPQMGNYKVYIIDEVHMLSTAAFNAFLKILEEPPCYVIFILATTEKHKILPTILSRCQTYDFCRINVADIVNYLEFIVLNEQIFAEKEALIMIAKKADGGMRDALSIFDQAVNFSKGNLTYRSVIDNLNLLDYDYYIKLSEFILEGNIPQCLLFLDELFKKGFDGQQIIGELARFFRDLMVCKDPQTIELFDMGESVKNQYLSLAKQFSSRFLYQVLEWTNECDLTYRTAKNKRLLIELLLIRLCQRSFFEKKDDLLKTHSNILQSKKEEIVSAQKEKFLVEKKNIPVVEKDLLQTEHVHKFSLKKSYTKSLFHIKEQDFSSTISEQTLDKKKEEKDSQINFLTTNQKKFEWMTKKNAVLKIFAEKFQLKIT